MIVRKIRIENWRNFVTPFEVVLSDNITVLTGANGQGKSTIVEAMRRAFFDRHTSSGESIRTLQPWGRDLSPRVEIEFVSDATVYCLSKQFIAAAHCMLSRLENGAWTNFKEGEAAEEWLRGILHGQASAKGFSKAEHWGLTRILWVPQGECDYGAVSDSLRSLIAPASGADTGGGKERPGRIEEEIRRRYGEYFTEKGAPRKIAGSIDETEKLLEGDRRRTDELRTQLAEIDKYDLTAREASRCAGEYRNQIEARMATLKVAEAEVRQYQADALAAALCRANAVAIEREKNQLKSRVEQLSEAVAEMEKTSREKAAALEEGDAYALALKEAEIAAVEAQRALGRLEADAEKVKTAKADAMAAAHFIEITKERVSLDTRKNAVDRLTAEIKKLQEQIGAERAPEKKEIQHLRATLEECSIARRELSALQLGLQFTAQRQVQWKTLSGTPIGERTINPGETVAVEGVGALEVVIDGTGVLRVTGPVDKNAEQLVKKIATSGKQVEALRERFGTINPEVLQDRFANVQLFAGETDLKKNEMKRVLGEYAYPRLIERIAQLEAAANDALSRYPAWAAQAPDASALQGLAERLHDEVSRKTHRATLDAERARAETELVRAKMADAATRGANAAQRCEGLEIKCARLRDNENDAVLKSRLDAATEAHLLAVRELTAREEKLRIYNGNPDDRLASLKTAIDDLRKLLAAREAEQSRAATEISVRGGKGLYSELAESEERLSAAETTLAARKLRASALKLLFDTVAQVRSQQRERFATPVAQRASQLFRKINGRRPGAITFGESMEVAGFLPAETAATGREVDVPSNLSGGEQEQLFFAARLALAEHLVPPGAGKHLVVLDDFLTATDDARLSSIKELIVAMKERFQFLVLTCHPERYMGLGDMVEIG